MNVLSRKIGPQGFRARDFFSSPFFFLFFLCINIRKKCINIKIRTFVFSSGSVATEPLSNGEGSWLWSVATSTSGVRRAAVSYRKRKGAGPGKYRSWKARVRKI